jgi:hypothetical protein
LLIGAPVAGALGLAGAYLAGSRLGDSASGAAGFTAAPDLGISPGNSAATNRDRLISALSEPSRCVWFPPGDYLIDNGEPNIDISNFSGQLAMQTRARLVFTDPSRSGIIFSGGDGARFFRLSATFADRPTKRVDTHEAIKFQGSRDTYLEDVRIDGSAAAGLVFYNCIRPMVSGAFITNTMADGLFFANCQDGRADHAAMMDTGNGISFVNYNWGPEYSGGLATNITVTRSLSRGIAVVGQRGVTFRDVSIDTTAGHGAYCAHEPNWKTRVPTDVCFERVRVVNGGIPVKGVGGNHSGLRVAGAESISVRGVTVDSPGGNGVYLTDSASVVLREVVVRNSPAAGFNVQNSSLSADELTAEKTKGIGFAASGGSRLEYGSMTMRNTALEHPSHHAVVVENTAHVFGGRIWIHDDQPSATGYVVRAAGAQKGHLGTVVDQVTSRRVAVDNLSRLPLALA